MLGRTATHSPLHLPTDSLAFARIAHVTCPAATCSLGCPLYSQATRSSCGPTPPTRITTPQVHGTRDGLLNPVSACFMAECTVLQHTCARVCVATWPAIDSCRHIFERQICAQCSLAKEGVTLLFAGCWLMDCGLWHIQWRCARKVWRREPCR